VVDQTDGTAPSGTDDVIPLLTEFFNAPLTFVKLKIILQNQQLYTSLAETTVQHNIDILTAAGKQDAATHVQKRWSSVAQCKEYGVEGFFRKIIVEFTPPWASQFPEILYPAILDADSAFKDFISANDRTAGRTIYDVVDTHRAVISSPEFNIAPPIARAEFLANYSEAIVSADSWEIDPDYAQSAYRAAREAADLSTSDVASRGRCLSSLAKAAEALSDQRNSSELLAEAIHSMREAVSMPVSSSSGLFNAEDRTWAESRNAAEQITFQRRSRLARLLAKSYDDYNNPEHLDESIEIYEELARATGEPAMEASLAYRLFAKFSATSSIANLERARQITSALLSRADVSEADRAYAASVNGNCLEVAYLMSGNRSDLDAMIESYTIAAGVSLEKVSLGQYSRYNNNLAGSLARRAISEDHDSAMADLQEAISIHRKISDLVQDRGHPERARFALSLAMTYYQRYVRGRDEGDLDQAITLCRAVLDEAPPADVELLCLMDLAAALRLRYEHSGHGDDLVEGVARYRQAAHGVASDKNILETLKAQHYWAVWALKRSAWQEAAEAFDLMVQSVERMLQQQAMRDHLQEVVSMSQGLSSNAGYAWAKAGDASRAVQAMERAQGLLVSQSLSREVGQSGVAVPGDIGKLAKGFRNREADELVVYIAAAGPGGVAVLVYPDLAVPPRTVWLPTLSESKVASLLTDYFRGYSSGSDGFSQVLDSVCAELWLHIIGPLIDELSSHTRAIIVPCGMLTYFPLHAAWRADELSSDNRIYAIDKCEFIYAPNLSIHLAARKNMRELSSNGSILFVSDPQHLGGEVLALSTLESDGAIRYFKESTVLSGKDATTSAVLDALPGHCVLHFSCHASADLANPWNSSLMLAGRDMVSVSELLRARLSGTELCILSACETGLAGLELPDEAISIGSSLLYAGSGGVIASLWSVYEASTALLMRKFYQGWKREGLSASAALRASQLWLKAATRMEILRELADLGVRLRSGGAALDGSNIIHWAAFAFNGACVDR
jgi:CHAT domain-containing protein/tetratricopeptide (TPR) repeat protein